MKEPLPDGLAEAEALATYIRAGHALSVKAEPPVGGYTVATPQDDVRTVTFTSTRGHGMTCAAWPSTGYYYASG